MTPSDLIAQSLPYIASHLDELALGLAALVMVLFAVAAAAWRGR